jgi:tetratricopeptide (TPR) repeat protein
MKPPPIPVVLLVLLLIGGCATAYTRGRTALGEGRYLDAAADFEQVLRERPDRVSALVGLGVARYHLGRYDEARDALERAASREPRNDEAQLYLGLAYLQKGDMVHAEERLRMYRNVPHYPRVTAQIDQALGLLRSERPLSDQTRAYVAASLENAAHLEGRLREAEWAQTAYFPPPFYDWPVQCVATRHGPVCF